MPCRYAQGYFISRPMPASQFDHFLQASEWGLEEKYAGNVRLFRPQPQAG